MEYSNRLRFPKGRQRQFIENSIKKLNLKNVEVSKMINVSVRTLTDWQREKFSLSLPAARWFSYKSGVSIPKNAKVESPFWYAKKGASRGGINMYKKYGHVGGDPEVRKKKWYEWWQREGKDKTIIINRLPFTKARLSEKLAEFIGIMMGDGGMSNWQITVTLHHRDDLEFSYFVIGMIKNLFGVIPSVHHDSNNSVNDIVVSRKGLVEYLHSLGLPIGNKIKQGFDIPIWIKENNTYTIACLRGLIDTDGSVFTHKYKVSGKWYSYKKICFTSGSQSLRNSVYDILGQLEIKARLAGKDVRIDSQSNVEKYFKLVGSHNPKHLNRYKN